MNWRQFRFVVIALIFSLYQGWNVYSFMEDHVIGCISHHEADIICKQRGNSLKTISCSIDLGYNTRTVHLNDFGISIASDTPCIATWEQLQRMVKKKKGCYALYDDGREPWKISTISPTTNYPASLCPQLQKSGAPTLLLGGCTMHRISGDNMDPMMDTFHKLNSLRITATSKILDTCMGLGYTSIEAATKIKRLHQAINGTNIAMGSVTTIEYDEASLLMASYNPWSQGLFNHTLPLTILEGDATKIVNEMPVKEEYDVIVHDPPALSICQTGLYSAEFYSQLYRLLKKPTGQLFHYIGNPESKESGKLYKGVQQRLAGAGFRKILTLSKAFGLLATV